MVRTRDDSSMIDFLDRFGASILANDIQRYWRERGHEIYTEIVPNPNTPFAERPIYCIRSNLINGAPPKRVMSMVRSA